MSERKRWKEEKNALMSDDSISYDYIISATVSNKQSEQKINRKKKLKKKRRKKKQQRFKM